MPDVLVWYCSNCSFGPLNPQIDLFCPNCWHQRCAYCPASVIKSRHDCGRAGNSNNAASGTQQQYRGHGQQNGYGGQYAWPMSGNGSNGQSYYSPPRR